MNEKRPYSSELRQEQAEATRARILAAAMAEMSPGTTELPFEKVAARVPVSVRTVYRYFPTQHDLLIAALTELEKRSNWHAEKVTAENMAALTRELFIYLDKNFGKDQPTPSEMDPVRQEFRGHRISAIERVIGPLTEDMDPGLARGVMRSSALAEDLEAASFAGQYETVLGVQGPSAILEATRTVRETANDERVAVYRQSHGPEDAEGIAVLVQRMVASEVSGVAFTAHPLTGAREETVITAARGLGEVVVSGETAGEQWVVSGGKAVRDRRAPAAVLTQDQALAVAMLARRVEDVFGGASQDIEWAFAGGELYLLQARPMTALPDPVSWAPPLPGGWSRIFRIGEWLPEPVTPLCDTWLLTRMEERYAARCRTYLGVAPPLRGRPRHSGPRHTGRLAPGEILVTSATTPAWTPLFARAAAVVTDGGSLAAHVSLVAREYGIPAVVALGDATRRILDGQRITVDGSAGVVEVLE